MKKRTYLKIKRLFDIAASFLGIVITLPIWIVAIIGIELSDPGPVFYKAERIGFHNQPFTMWKFRSMRVAKNKQEKSEASFKADTNRIFKWGEIMRATKIDELPQLINILNGTMSIVGPRPAAKDQVAIMRAGKYNLASKVRPGLTGPAALYDYLYGDSIEDLEDYERLVLPTRLELEAYYPKHFGAFFDLKMIVYTVICIVSTVAGKFPQKIFDELTGYVKTKNVQK